jgi:hypothetical protein
MRATTGHQRRGIKTNLPNKTLKALVGARDGCRRYVAIIIYALSDLSSTQLAWAGP